MADVIQFTFQHQHLFTHDHVIEVVEVTITYRGNMSIVSNSSSNEGAH